MTAVEITEPGRALVELPDGTELRVEYHDDVRGFYGARNVVTVEHVDARVGDCWHPIELGIAAMAGLAVEIDAAIEAGAE